VKRWITFIGRGGTVLVSIGLALLLVSLIPSTELGTQGTKTAVPPDWVQPLFERVVTPQQGLQITVTANGTLDVYILEISSEVLYQGLDDFLNLTFINVSDLEKFLEANPSVVGWHNEVNNVTATYDYVPTKVTNATLVLSNPSSDYVPVDLEIVLTSSLGPGTKVRQLAQYVIPVGLVMLLPWIIYNWKRKMV
jgi:hypothetical protein